MTLFFGSNDEETHQISIGTFGKNVGNLPTFFFDLHLF